MKRLLFSLFLLPVLPVFSAPLAIGEKVTSMPVGVWYRNAPAPVEQWLGKKTFAVLFITPTVPDILALRRIEQMAESLKKQGVGVFYSSPGLPKNPGDVPAWKDVKTPVMFDLKSDLFELLSGKFEKIPFAAVVTSGGELAWRGRIDRLPALLRELAAGKYRIADASRREKFTERLDGLIRARKYQEAVDAITAEQKFEPANVELVGLKCNLLWRRLKNAEAAFREIDRALAADPALFALYDFKLRLMRQASPGKPVMPLFREMAAKFGDKPALLMGQFSREMNVPLAEMCPEGALLLARTAASAPKFKDRQEEGFAHLNYARMLHYCGRPELAAAEAGKAAKLLTGKSAKLAETVEKHFRTVAKLSKTLE